MTCSRKLRTRLLVLLTLVFLYLLAGVEAFGPYRTFYVGHLLEGVQYEHQYVYQDEITHHAYTFEASAGDVLTLSTQWVTEPPPAGYGDPWQPDLIITPGMPPVNTGEVYTWDWDADFAAGNFLPKDLNNIEKPTITDWEVPATGTYTLHVSFYPYQDSSGGIYNIGFMRTASASPADGATVASPQLEDGVLDSAGEILFITNDGNGDGDIWIMNADGTNKRVILDSSQWDVNPTWSPDGSQIAFISNRSMLSFDIYVMNADGSNQTRVADLRFHDVHPIWSPVNGQIVFHSKENNGIPGLFIIEDGGVRPLIDTASSEQFADWSPDGSQIVFSSNSDGDSDLYVIRADGSDLRQLTNIGGAIWPRWSPDGSKIAFYRTADGNTDIYVMNADGTSIQRLTTDPASDSKPVWSPDSAFIAFQSNRTGNGDIYVINLAGVVVSQLTDSPLQEEANDWRINDSIPAAPVEDSGKLATAPEQTPPGADSAQDTVPQQDNSNSLTGSICTIPPIEEQAGNPWREPALTTCVNNVLLGMFITLDTEIPDQAPHCIDEWGNLTTAGYVGASPPDNWQSTWDGERYKRICCGWEAPYNELLQNACNCPCNESSEPVSSQLLTTPIVYGVLFYSPTCQYSQTVINEVLPPLKEEFGDQFQVVYIDISTTEGLALYQAAGSALAPNHIAFSSMSTPILVIGDTILVGGRDIADELQGLIRDGLAAGGIDIPAISGLREAADLTSLTNVDLAAIMTRIPPPISPSRIEQVGDNGSGLPAFISYAFEPEEIAPGVFLDMSYGWVLDAGTARQSLRWDFRNESGDTTTPVEYIADIPKSFAPTVGAIEFSVPPAQIINDDPIVKWIIDFTNVVQRRIDARALTMIDLTALGDPIALAEQFQQQLNDINLRRRMAACQYTISDAPTEKALCTLTVIAQSTEMFTPQVCETFGDVTGVGDYDEAIAFTHACRDIFARNNNFHCNSLADDSAMQATCLNISRMVYSEACTGLTGIDYDMCQYDVAVDTGQVGGCDFIANQDLALDCRALLADDPTLCRQISDPARHRACCEIFVGNSDQYNLCMKGVGEDVIDGEPADNMGDDQGETLTLDEVLGTDDDSPSDNTSSDGFAPLPTVPNLGYLMNDAFYAEYVCDGQNVRFIANGGQFFYATDTERSMPLPGNLISFMADQGHEDFAMTSAFMLGSLGLWMPLDGSTYSFPAVTEVWVTDAESYDRFTALDLRPAPDSLPIAGNNLDTIRYEGSYTQETVHDNRNSTFADGYFRFVDTYTFRSWYDLRTGMLVQSHFERQPVECYREGDYADEECPRPLGVTCTLVDSSVPILGR